MYHISFPQIQYFLKVAECNNFTKASKLLYISQPALSKQISALEKELGLTLFIRNKHSIKLTPEGESLYQDWKAITKSMEISIKNANIIKDLSKNRINIGLTNGFNFDDEFFDVVNLFKSKYKDTKTNIESLSLKHLKKKFKEDELDIIFIPIFGMESFKDIKWTHFQKIDFAIAISTANSLSKNETLEVTDLKNESFIVLSAEESSTSADKTKLTCRNHGFEPNIVKYCTNISSLLLSVKNNEGVSFCNSKISSKGIKIFKIESKLHDDDMDLIAVWKKENNSTQLSSFIDILKLSKAMHSEH